MVEQLFNSKERAVLEIKNRRLIYTLIKKYAGSHFRELERKSKQSMGNFSYHVGYLIKSGLVSELKEGRLVRYFPKESMFENKKLLGILRNKRNRDILIQLLFPLKNNQETIAKEIGISPSTLSWYLTKLQEQGIISSKKEGRNRRYTLLISKSEIVALLINYQESFTDTLVDRIIEMWE